MSSCDYCGNKISWVQIKTENETKNVAIDLNEPVYHHDGEKWVKSGAYVNHFAVCPHRKKWKKNQLEKKEFFEKQMQQQKRPWWVED